MKGVMIEVKKEELVMKNQVLIIEKLKKVIIQGVMLG